MEKIASGSNFIYKDQTSRMLEQEIKPTGSLQITGTTGEYKEETIASLLQIAPALYGEIFGLTKTGMKIAAVRFDMGSASAFAQSILDEDALFEQIIRSLMSKGMIRQEIDDEPVYFPERQYLQQCKLIAADSQS